MTAPQLRMLALSSSIIDERIVTTSYRSSTSLLDYDVLLWEPSRVLSEYYRPRYDRARYRGLLSLDEDASFELVRSMHRRRAEMVSFLELGRTVIMIVPPMIRWYIDTGERTTSGTGRNQKVTHHVAEMTVKELVPFTLDLQDAEGDEIELKLGEPFAAFWAAQRERLYYSAVMTKHPGQVAAAVKGTDKPVAAIAHLGKGTVVMIPTVWWPEIREDDEEDPDDTTVTRTERSAMDAELVEALLHLAAELRAQMGEYALPRWAGELRLPGEDELQSALYELQAKVAEMQETLDARRAEMKRLEERKVLFTGSGAALEHVVEDALSALGFTVERGAPGRTDRLLTREGSPAVVEIKGKTKSAAEKDAAQLEKWVASYHAEHDQQPKGILIVNGWRDVPLGQREARPTFPEQMLEYAKGRGQCLITGLQLLCASIDADSNPARGAVIANEIMGTVGVYQGYADWRQSVAEVETAIEA